MKIKSYYLLLISLIFFVFININVVCNATINDTIINSMENEFNTHEWILRENGAVCDISIGKLRLDYLNSSVPYYEDMNDYTQVDGLNAITIDSSTQVHYLWANWRGTTDTYLYKTKNGLNDFTLRFAIYVERIDNNAVSFRAGLVHFTDVLGGLTDSINSDSFFVMFMGTTSTTQYRLGCMFTRAGNPNFLDDGVFGALINIDTWYYIKIVKSGTAFNLYVYSDTSYSTLVTSDSQNIGINMNPDYIILGSTLGYATTVNIEWYTKNVYFGGYNPSGEIYTVNLMNNITTGNLAYELLVNITTLSSTSITIDISNDNITWINNILSFSSGLTDKQYGIYLFDRGWNETYVRFEFISTNYLNTPIVNNIIFQHTFIVSGGSSINYALWIVLITCVPSMLLILYKVKRK